MYRKRFSIAFLAANWIAFLFVVAFVIYSATPVHKIHKDLLGNKNIRYEVAHTREEGDDPIHKGLPEKPLNPDELDVVLGRNQKTTQQENNNNNFQLRTLSQLSLKHKGSFLSEELKKTVTSDFAVMEEPDCFFRGCVDKNNALTVIGCDNEEADEMLRQGVEHMERYMQGEISPHVNYQNRSLYSAKESFEEAIAIVPECTKARENLGLVLMKLGMFQESQAQLEKSNTPRSKVLRGVCYELMNDDGKAMQYYKQAIAEEPLFDREYHGIILGTSGVIHKYSPEHERKVILNQLLWKEFASVSLANYGILPPKNIQEVFAKERWMVIKQVVPPFILKSVQECYHGMIKDKKLKLGDAQSLRYVAYNSRCLSFMHRSYADFVRKIVSHNAKPSYTYFGGYVEGAELVPHTDRQQCEFTLSLTIQNNPDNSYWPLGLDIEPEWKGKRDEYGGNNMLGMPPKDRQRWANLLAGDVLVFMGRRHNHFREGKLGPGRWLNQVFMHYVPERFDKSLG